MQTESTLTGVIIGASTVGSLLTLLGQILNHWLTGRREHMEVLEMWERDYNQANENIATEHGPALSAASGTT